MATPTYLEILLDPLSTAQKAAIASWPMVTGVGADMRVRVVVLPGRLTVSQDDPPPVERYNDGTARIPTASPRPLTWEITLDAAHGRMIGTILEMLHSAFQSLTFSGSPAVTRLWDYSRPIDGGEDYTEFTVTMLDFSAPQDAILGSDLRYIQPGSVTLQEVV